MDSERDKRFFSQFLLKWYAESKRRLPWRESKDPYRIWVSEVMLQQTRVDTAIPYFERFVRQFPTIEALAYAPEEEVLKAWEGLGYYSRARNLQSAVREVQERYGGVVPQEKAEIASLKGVGPYTSGAILSIAYNKPEPAVDGNVMRVLARFFLIEQDIAKSGTRVLMEQLAQELIPAGEAGEFNQALMELGALVCTPRSPDCGGCPVQSRCAALAAGREQALPLKARAKPPRPEQRVAALIRGAGAQRGKLLLRQRPAAGLLARMWELPHYAYAAAEVAAAVAQEGGAATEVAAAGASPSSPQSVAAPAPGGAAAIAAAEAAPAPLALPLLDGAAMAQQLRAGLAADGLPAAEPLGYVLDAEHTFSHIRWHMAVFECRLPDGAAAEALPTGWRWVGPGEMGSYAFPKIFLNIIRQCERMEA
jgi:A/G-specific adenine glycosylase